MVYAASRDALRRSLVGIAFEIQGTDFSEIAHETGPSRARIVQPSSHLTSAAVLDKASRGA